MTLVTVNRTKTVLIQDKTCWRYNLAFMVIKYWILNLLSEGIQNFTLPCFASFQQIVVKHPLTYFLSSLILIRSQNKLEILNGLNQRRLEPVLKGQNFCLRQENLQRIRYFSLRCSLFFIITDDLAVKHVYSHFKLEYVILLHIIILLLLTCEKCL